MHNIYYNKYLKYKNKNIILGQNQYDHISIPSQIDKYYQTIHATTASSDKPAKMWFNSHDNVYQSAYRPSDIDKFYLFYMNSFMTFLMYIDKLDDILFIGLGGGHIPMLLRKYFSDLSMTVIELDPAIVTAATFMGLKTDDKMNIIIDDGSRYLKKNVQKLFDAIVIDLDGIASFASFDFSDIAKWLTSDGILAINCYNDNKPESLSKLIKPYFKSIKIYKSKNNFIYMCKKQSYMFRDINDASKSKLLKNYKYLSNLINKVKALKYINL